MIKCCIFDLDGTLVDSMKYWYISPLEFVRGYNVEIDDSFSDTFLSLSLIEDAKIIKRDYLPFKSENEIVNEIDTIMENYYLTKVELKTGIKELIKYLYNKNIKLAIASSTDKCLIEKIAERLDIKKYFDFIISTAEINISKNHPDVYQKCSDYFNIPYNETMIFEDLPYGLFATKDLGFIRVGVYDEYSKSHKKSMIENSDYFFDELSIKNIEPLI